MKKHIPNILTCCNLLCGAVAVYMATQSGFAVAFGLIILAAVFDFFDGFAARLLHVASPIGKELDSLADNITFGLAPTMMLFCYLRQASGTGVWAGLVLLMAAFSALRLAKFNLDTRQSDSFIGLATPANAIFWASLITCLYDFYPVALPAWVAWGIVLMSLVSCYLLIAEIPFFALKFHNFSWKDNRVRFVFLIGSVLLIVACIIGAILAPVHRSGIAYSAGAVVIVWYVGVGVFTALPTKH